MKTIALIAHDSMKSKMVDWAARHQNVLLKFKIYATGTTGGLVQKKCPTLHITLLKSGPLGGDQQVGALIAEGKIGALIFFTDPLSAMPHDVDVKALTRLSTLYDIPMACNPATADLIISAHHLGE